MIILTYSELDDVESIEDDNDKYDIEGSFISTSNNSIPPSFTSGIGCDYYC